MHQVVQGRSADAQYFRRPDHIAIGAGERERHSTPLGLFPDLTQIDEFSRSIDMVETDVLGSDLLAIRHDHCSLDGVFQFPDVAGPRMSLYCSYRIFGERHRPTLVLT